MNLSIGENIRIMRRKCGFTQEELASMLSVTPQAISKWENGNGTPDISQLVPLAQIFGITTDSLLGVASAAFGNAHTEAALNHEKLLMATSQSKAERHLAAYTYFRAESEKEPTNYDIMRKCINHGADLSRFTNLNGFLADKPEFRDEIFADCERKNQCISRYCDDRDTVEKANFAMAWVYIHTQKYDKAKQLIDRLPSIESNNLKETIMTKFIKFQHGFEASKPYITANIRSLVKVTAKEFYYDLEDYVWSADAEETLELSRKLFDIMNAYKAFGELHPVILDWENHIRRFMPRCYAKLGEYDKAAGQLMIIIQNCRDIFNGEDALEHAKEEIGFALEYLDECHKEKLACCKDYQQAMEIING